MQLEVSWDFLGVRSNHFVGSGISFMFYGQSRNNRTMNDKWSIEMKCL